MINVKCKRRSRSYRHTRQVKGRALAGAFQNEEETFYMFRIS